MSEKFRKNVNVPHRAVKKLKENIKATKPKKTVGKIARGAGVGAASLTQALLWFAEHLTLDNFVTRGGEKAFSKIKVGKNEKGQDKKIPKLVKQNPNLTAIVSWWMLLSVLTGVGIKNKDKIVDVVKDKIENVKNILRNPDQNKRGTIKTLKIDPSLPDDQWMAQIDAIWPYIYMETVLSEGFVNEAYADVGDSGGYMTIGSGYMIGRAKPKGNKDRELIKERKAFFKKVLGKQYTNGVSVSFDENRRLVRAFYETYVWPYMKKQFSAPMDAHLFIELGIGMYNRGSGIYKQGQNGKKGYDGEHISQAVNDHMGMNNIVNRFDDLCKSGNAGLEPKYGVAAHRALGNIKDSVVLNSYANSVYGMSSKKLWQDGQLKDYPDVAVDLMGVPSADILKNGKTYSQLRLYEYLSPQEVEIITNGGLFNDFVLQTEQVQTKESVAEKLNEQGEKLYFEGQYEKALEKYWQAIKEDPGFYIVYSNIVIAQYQLGKYDSGLLLVDDVVHMIDFKFAPKEVQGYTYFNGSLCYEKKGDNEENPSKKLEYYNKAMEYATQGETIAETKYKSLKSRLNKKINETQKNKTIAFNMASNRVKINSDKTGVVNNIKNTERRA